MRLLLLLAGELLVRELLPPLDDLRTRNERVALVSDLRFEGGEGESAGGEGGGDGRVVRGDDFEGRMEGRCEASEVGAEKGGGRGLEGLDAVVLGRGGRDGGSVRAEEVLVELNRARGVIDSHVQVAAAAGLGDEALDALAGDFLLSVGNERSELDDTVDLEARVDLGELLEEAS